MRGKLGENERHIRKGVKDTQEEKERSTRKATKGILEKEWKKKKRSEKHVGKGV